MNVFSKRIGFFALAGGLLVGGCALAVLFMAREPMESIFALKFLSVSTGFGLLLGWLAALYVHCSQQERLRGIGDAILLSILPLIIGALCIGVLTERPSADDRRHILWITAGTLAWWLLMFIAGVVRVRSARWGNTLQALLVWPPILAVLAGSLYFFAAQPPEPGGFWSRWNGTRLVGVTILLPACGIGLLLSLLDGGLVYVVGAFAFALMSGAVLGEWVLGSFGWPVAGAFAGGLTTVGALGSVVARSRRTRERRSSGSSH